MDERLDELLLCWEEQAEAGRPVSAMELCRDCPELAEELQGRIDALREMGWLAGLRREGDGLLLPGAEPMPGYRLVRRPTPSGAP